MSLTRRKFVFAGLSLADPKWEPIFIKGLRIARRVALDGRCLSQSITIRGHDTAPGRSVFFAHDVADLSRGARHA